MASTALSQLAEADEQSLARFQETLSDEDQKTLAELFEATHLYDFAARNAGPVDPMTLLLLILLIEEHKRLRFLVEELDYYQQKHFNRKFSAEDAEDRPGQKRLIP